MFYVPTDLFSPYIEGKREAISDNWNDLNQANNVEGGWLDNDRKNVDNLFQRATYGDNLATTKNNSLVNSLNTQQKGAAQPGALATIENKSDYQEALADSTAPYLTQIANNNAKQELGTSVDNAAQGDALIQYAPQVRTAQSRAQLVNANNSIAQSNNATAQGDYAAKLLPHQYSANLKTLEAQQKRAEDYLNLPPAAQINSMGGVPTDSLFPQAQNPPMTSTDVWNSAANLTPGQSATVGGNDIGRDDKGVYIMSNGTKAYVPQPSQSAPASDLFNF